MNQKCKVNSNFSTHFAKERSWGKLGKLFNFNYTETYNEEQCCEEQGKSLKVFVGKT